MVGLQRQGRWKVEKGPGPVVRSVGSSDFDRESDRGAGKTGCSHTERAHQCCRQKGVFRARERAKAVGGGGRRRSSGWANGGCRLYIDKAKGSKGGEEHQGQGSRDTKDRLKEEEEEETERPIPNRRPIPSRQVTVGFRLSVAVDRSQQEMERYILGRRHKTRDRAADGV
eukprot:scaffold19773_cov109-Amphora_coffeaeformis.AAC.1